jgi:probable phosphoglycerate mutase
MISTRSSRVLLLRHAETTAPDLFHGAESDVGLSERGLRQAESIAPILAREQPAAIISSPMRRAVETAAPIAQACGLPIQIEPALHERRIGSLCGQPYEALHGPWAETLRRWQAGDLAYATPGAESFLTVRDRVLPVWFRLGENFAAQTYCERSRSSIRIRRVLSNFADTR